MRFLLCLLFAGCVAGDKATDTDAAGCDASFRTEDFQDPDREQACVNLDASLSETVVHIAKCLDSECFASEDITSDGFAPVSGDGSCCVDNDKEHMYRFTILYCTPPPPADLTTSLPWSGA